MREKQESDVLGGAHVVWLQWLKFLPSPSSHFSPPYTHISPGELAAYLHMCVALSTGHHLSVHQNPGALKKNSHPKKNKENDSPTTVQTFQHMINTHQAELRCLNCLFFKDVCDAVCQVACPSGEPAGVLVRGRFTYYLAPQPAGG